MSVFKQNFHGIGTVWELVNDESWVSHTHYVWIIGDLMSPVSRQYTNWPTGFPKVSLAGGLDAAR